MRSPRCVSVSDVSLLSVEPASSSICHHADVDSLPSLVLSDSEYVLLDMLSSSSVSVATDGVVGDIVMDGHFGCVNAGPPE